MKKIFRKRAQMFADEALCELCHSHDIRFAGKSVFGDHRPMFKCGSCKSNVWTSGTKGLPYSKYVEIEDWYNWDHVLVLSNEARVKMGLAATISGKHIPYDRHVILVNDLCNDLCDAVGVGKDVHVDGRPGYYWPRRNVINADRLYAEVDLRKGNDFILEFKVHRG